MGRRMTFDDALQTDAVGLLLQLEDAGFDLKVAGGRLRLHPLARLSAAQRAAIAAHREALIALVDRCCVLAAGDAGREVA